ncbi:response regulator transcription factor [Pantoea sp. BS_4]|uniref:LuxR C-terminal-related transcriptional regulator n=1 Tax=unclassified Pantoea TaxID=2630326 RepID=UPI003F7D38CE
MNQKIMVTSNGYPLFLEGVSSTVVRVFPNAEINHTENINDITRELKSEKKFDVVIFCLCLSHLMENNLPSNLKELLVDAKLIVLTMCDDVEKVSSLFPFNIDGLICSNVETSTFIELLCSILRGEKVVYYKSTHREISYRSEFDNLTLRQRDVLRLIASGDSNKEIAKKLGISPFTVRIHVSKLLKTLKLTSRSAAAVFYINTTNNFKENQP